MRKFTPTVFLCLALLAWRAKATHNRAGEIVYKRIAPFSKVVGGLTVAVYNYSITVIKYTDHVDADRCIDTLDFGDGETGYAPRINHGVTSCECANPNDPQIGCGQIISNQQDHVVKLNIYTITHTYPGPGSYLIRSFDRNRNADVINIPQSVTTPFYIESFLNINTFTGANTSPRFAFAPIDKACHNQCFEHNPGAFDEDGDSLSFELTASRGEQGLPLPGYSFPGGDYTINRTTGELRWCSPSRIGEYNLAFIVYEWRKNTNKEYQMIGYVLRDMQVIVENCDKQAPPAVQVPSGLCVVAGDLISEELHVTDPDKHVVSVSGGGLPFEGADPRATITNSSAVTGSSGFDAVFSWQTACAHIRNMPYQITVKAVDDGSPVKQVSFSSFNVRVVAPPLENLTAQPAGSSMNLSWNAASCDPSSNPVVSYQVYRKTGCDIVSPQPCSELQTSGYELIATLPRSSVSYEDNDKGKGLIIGESYQYIVVAVYRDGLVSAAGQQVCARLKRDVPVMLHADVRLTSPGFGLIFTSWTRPVTGPDHLDTNVYRGPYRFVLMHSDGEETAAVFTSTGQTLSQLDTSFDHGNINTALRAHTYQVEFYAGETLVGRSQRATSLFLSAAPGDKKVTLSWKAEVPWSNYEYQVMRMSPGSQSFVTIGTSTEAGYVDSAGVLNGHSYCYRIRATGRYSSPEIFRPLINHSQDSCVIPKDVTPPCTPTIDLVADCPEGFVRVSWSDVLLECASSGDLLQYSLFHKKTLKDEYVKVSEGKQNSVEFTGLSFISGCYAVQATDTNQNSTGLSREFCIDNCPVFELPNIFTPNSDGSNDEFKAIRVRQIKEIDLLILDRWGNKVFSTKDPYFRWNGVSSLSNQPCSEGTFFYVCEVFEPRLKGLVSRTLRGTVHLAR